MTELVLFCLICSLGMCVQSFVGFAGSLVAVPLFSLFISPKVAVPTYNLVMLVVNLVLVLETRQHVDWRRVGRLLIGGLVGIPIGAYGLKHLPVHVIGLIISVVTLTFAILFMFKVKVRLHENRPTELGIGLLSGWLGGAISESGPPVVVYGLARGWDKNTFRSTLITYFFFLCIMANVSFLYLGLLSWQSARYASAAVLPTLAAAIIGIWLKNRVNETFFRQAVLTVIVIVALLGLLRHALG
ncbi:MAG: hypothetical protein A3K19_10360 [Lentisphaerae bacterium RIFOXYB12_FULL_65_16]|nr:MAG: hypothetical protein A3K18_32220 [Lentisphaerae bacterium RIFOXYA12_64_32]OGV91619.1 MAG: hypothetical protein A3K19_10360 [Lentisphaerae bacterium RIFOXYB12_FULL_65_16]